MNVSIRALTIEDPIELNKSLYRITAQSHKDLNKRKLEEMIKERFRAFLILFLKFTKMTGKRSSLVIWDVL